MAIIQEKTELLQLDPVIRLSAFPRQIEEFKLRMMTGLQLGYLANELSVPVFYQLEI